MDFRKLDKVIVFLIVFIFYGFFIKHGDWNINSRLGLVKAVVEEHRLAIDSYHTGEFETEDKAFVNGHYYSDKAIGASALGIVLYWPIYQLTGGISSYSTFVMLITLLTISIPAALLAPILYKTVLSYTKDRWFSLLVALSISLGTAIFPYAGAFYGHSLSALAAFSAFSLWMDVNHFDAKITIGRSFLSGLLIGLLVLTEYPTAIIAIFLIGYIIHVAWSKKSLFNWNFFVPFALGGGMILALLLVYNKISFGSPFTTGYSLDSFEKFQAAFDKGFMGFEWPRLTTLFFMTFHPSQGVFFQSPILLFAVGGIGWSLQKKNLRAEIITALAIILVFFIAFSGVRLWWGGDAFSTRYMIPVFPFFTLFLLEIPKKIRPIFWAPGIISIFQMLIASATTFNGLDLATEKVVENGLSFSLKTFSLYTILLPRLLKNKLTLTWGNQLLGIESWYFNLAIPLLIAAIFIVLFYLLGRREPASDTV
jgi:hypothetical protein